MAVPPGALSARWFHPYQAPGTYKGMIYGSQRKNVFHLIGGNYATNTVLTYTCMRACLARQANPIGTFFRTPFRPIDADDSTRKTSP